MDVNNRRLQERRATLQRRLEALESAAIRRQGQEIETGTTTAIEVTKKQIAEIEEEIAKIRE
jgi:hypothetical protein